MTFMVQSITTGRQAWYWDSSWELRSWSAVGRWRESYLRRVCGLWKPQRPPQWHAPSNITNSSPTVQWNWLGTKQSNVRAYGAIPFQTIIAWRTTVTPCLVISPLSTSAGGLLPGLFREHSWEHQGFLWNITCWGEGEGQWQRQRSGAGSWQTARTNHQKKGKPLLGGPGAKVAF